MTGELKEHFNEPNNEQNNDTAFQEAVNALRRGDKPRAKELLMTGEVMNGERAAEIGLITHAVDPADLDARVYGLAEQLASGASIAINATKTAVNLLLRHQLDALLDAHTGLEFESFGSEDHREAVFAFKEKRTPKFTGR